MYLSRKILAAAAGTGAMMGVLIAGDQMLERAGYNAINIVADHYGIKEPYKSIAGTEAKVLGVFFSFNTGGSLRNGKNFPERETLN